MQQKGKARNVYKGEQGLKIRRKGDWLKQFEEKMIGSGLILVLNSRYIKKNVTEKEMINLSPSESVRIYAGYAKEIWGGDDTVDAKTGKNELANRG